MSSKDEPVTSQVSEHYPLQPDASSNIINSIDQTTSKLKSFLIYCKLYWDSEAACVLYSVCW